MVEGMVSVFRFQKKYFFAAFLLFLVEVFIAVFIHDKFIRPYGGDFLVVVMIYCFLKSFWNEPVWVAAVSVLLFSYLVEVSQYFKLIIHLGLQNSKLATVILGRSFQWFDMLAYTLGIVLVFCLEKMRMGKS